MAEQQKKEKTPVEITKMKLRETDCLSAIKKTCSWAIFCGRLPECVFLKHLNLRS